jgi:hypothetical protein
MAYITGDADNHLHLLEVLRDFLTTNAALVADSQEWEVVGGIASGTFAAGDYVSLKGPGLGGTDQIFLTIKTHTNVPAGIFSLQMRGHTAYNPAVPTDTPPGLNSPWVYLPLINDPIRYWMMASGRRFIMIAKANNRYDMFYGGFMLPEHLPADWSYPMLIGGSANGLMAASVEGATHRNFWSPYTGQGYVFTPAQIWRDMTYVTFSESPGGTGNELVSVDWVNDLSFPNKARAIDNSPYIAPGRIAEMSSSDLSPRNFLGVYDGIFYTPAAGTVVEQIIENGGKDYLVVSNVFRNTDNNLAAICLE